MDLPHDTSALKGTILGGKYRLERLLGAGGMGAVYAGENTFLRAPVAIKVMSAASAQSKVAVDRFVREAQAAAQVRHANIVGVFDIGYDDATGHLYIVQELLSGEDLRACLDRRGALPPREAIALLMPVMRALALAHSKGLVHRDLKPANIFLCETVDGVVPKVIDFGIVKMLGEVSDGAQITNSQQAIGTPHFMSPEQANGERSVDRRTDVWSLGVVLFHAVSGRFPHEGEGVMGVLASIMMRQPARLEDLAPSLPPEVAALVRGALMKDPDQRYPTMEIFWRAARDCCAALDARSAQFPAAGGGAPTPKQVDGRTRAMSTGAPFEARGRVGTDAAPRRSSRRALWGALGLASLAAVFAFTHLRAASPTAAPVAPPTSAPPRVADASARARAVVVSPPPRVADAGARVVASPPPRVADAGARVVASSTERAADAGVRARARTPRVRRDRRGEAWSGFGMPPSAPVAAPPPSVAGPPAPNAVY